MSSEKAPNPLSAVLAQRNYDFIDLGCSAGGSMLFAQKSLGGAKGIGIDIDPVKVDRARAAGLEALIADARTLAAYPRSVSFVSMIDFLEHLDGVRDAETCVRAASEAARDFLFIRQPWFDADGYLFSQGLKLFWSDWHGHPNAMTTLEFHSILSRLPRAVHWRLYGRGVIKGSSDPAVHPLASPRDQHDWRPHVHPPKRQVTFKQRVFRQIMCVVVLEGGHADIGEIEERVQFDFLLFDSQDRD